MISRSFTATSLSLLERVRAHDANAWRRFADLYSPLVYSWSRRDGLRDADAVDIVQEVFGILATRMDDFDPGRENSGFRSWLRAIARNCVRLHYRKSSRQPDAVGGSTVLQQLANSPEMDAEESAEDIATDRRYLLRRIVEFVRNDFEDTTWQAFWRTVVDGDTAPEAAEALRMTAGAVRQAKFRVLCRLREELAVL